MPSFATCLPACLHHQSSPTEFNKDLTERCSKDQSQGTYTRRVVFTGSDVPTVADELMQPRRRVRRLVTKAKVPCGSSVAVRVQPQELLPGFDGTNVFVEAVYTAAELPKPLDCSSVALPSPSPPINRRF